jgi:hypothetical protein
MFATQSSRVQQSPTALVVCHQYSSGAWHPEVLAMESALEDRLEGVYVTTATVTGRYPRTEDALAAAKYAGCDAAVLVHADVERAAGAPQRGADRGLTTVTVTADWSVESVISAFEDAKALAAPLPESVAV